MIPQPDPRTNKTLDHEDSEHCWCCPTLTGIEIDMETGDKIDIWVHNAPGDAH